MKSLGEKQMTEQELTKQITEVLPCFRDVFDRMPCPYNGACGECPDLVETAGRILKILPELAKGVGYVELPPDSAILGGVHHLAEIKSES